ncbi:MAG TPA: reverse transcriptase domain-containing protein, partial [Candidatus Babeliaceae bacterium]|nr:reverse transcriptase domain-containing protein [Candidatus Babeliaceae bacterium]
MSSKKKGGKGGSSQQGMGKVNRVSEPESEVDAVVSSAATPSDSLSTDTTLPSLIQSWTVMNVTEWLDSIGLGTYGEIIKKEEITGEDLIAITDQELTTLGITTFGHRKKLLREILKLKVSNSKGNMRPARIPTMEDHASSVPNKVIIDPLDSRIPTYSKMELGDEIIPLSENVNNLTVAAGNKPPKKQLPTFSGDKNNIPAYKLFKSKFKIYLDYYSIKPNQVHSNLMDALQNKAALWFAAYTDSHPDITSNTYDELMTILDTEYLNPLATSKYRLMYETMKADYSETVSELVTRIDTLATQAGKAIRTDQEKKIKLYELLPHYIQPLLIAQLHSDSTYEEFMTIAAHTKEHSDSMYQKRNKSRNGATSTTHSVSVIHKQKSQQFNNKHGDRRACLYCQRNNHPTFLCSLLLGNIRLGKAEAISFWDKNKLEEQLIKYNVNKNGTDNGSNNNATTATNTSNNNDNTTSQAVSSTSNINGTESKRLIYVDGKLNDYAVKDIFIDEGSQVSIISSRLYKEILMNGGRNVNYNLSIDELPILYQADGKTILPVKGKVDLQLRFSETIIGRFTFIIVDNPLHDALIGRDITEAANISIINDNGTQIVQGLDMLNPNIKFSDKVNIFKVNNIIKKNTKLIVSNIQQTCQAIINNNNDPAVSNGINEPKPEVNGKTNLSELPLHMKEITFGDMPEGFIQRIKELLIEYQDIFHKPGDPITPLNTHIKHRIRLEENAKPVRARIYPLPEAYNKIIKEQINSWLSLGIIRPSYSPWASPCILVDKKDQKAGRLCGVFCKLNDLTVMDAYPIREIEEQKSHFSGSVIFSQIDLKDAYLQVELSEESKEKTAIIVREGLFEFNRMIQGLKTAPATFHRIIDDSFKEVIGQCLEPYFDDLTVHSKSIQDHLIHLRQVFNIMRAYGFKAKASKVKLGVKELRWLGFIISNGTITPDTKIASSITELKAPNNVQELRMVLGL